MKKIILLVAFASFAFAANAQDAKVKKEEGTEHKCTDKCSKDKHATVCGEKGHKCGKDCEKEHHDKKHHDEKKADDKK